MPILTTQIKVATVEDYFQPISISLSETLHVEKVVYRVKFQEAVQSSNAISSTSFFPKVSTSRVNE